MDLCPENILKNTLKEINDVMKKYKCSKNN